MKPQKEGEEKRKKEKGFIERKREEQTSENVCFFFMQAQRV